MGIRCRNVSHARGCLGRRPENSAFHDGVRHNAIMKATANPEVLVVDDDRATCEEIKRLLSPHGFRVTGVADAEEMDRARRARHYHVILLDVVLPGEDGWSICKRLRAESFVGILMLSGERIEAAHRTGGLDLGADDYVTKPFDGGELRARVEAILRRASGVSGWRIDTRADLLYAPNGRLVKLTDEQFRLLLVLADNYPETVSHDDLLLGLLGPDRYQAHLESEEEFGNPNIPNRIRLLRRSLNDAYPGAEIIASVYRSGYRLTVGIARD